MTALRDAGEMKQAAGFAPQNPNRIVQSLWIGKLSPLEWACMQSFVRHGHEFHLYTYEPPARLPAGVVACDAREILPAERVFRNQHGKGRGSVASFSDLFRFHLLCDRGGWWTDLDVFCTRPFDFAAPYVFGAASDKGAGVANGVIKAPRGAPLLKRTIRSVETFDMHEVRWSEFGDVFSQMVSALGLDRYIVPTSIFSPIGWQDIPAFVRGERRYEPSPGSYATHLFHEMWRRNRIDKWRALDADSALEILIRDAKLAELNDPFPSRKPRSFWDWVRWPRQRAA